MVTERNIALYLYNNHFCLKWKSEKVSFNQANRKVKDIFQIVDNFTTEEIVNSHFKYDFIPNKIEVHLTNFIVYALETNTTDRAGPYYISFYRLNNLAGRYNRDLSPYEKEKRKKNKFVFDDDDCIIKALKFLLKIKGEERKVKNKNVEKYLQLNPHNGSQFDKWIILNILPCDKRIVDIIKNGKGINSLRVSNGYIQNNKKLIPQYLIFRCGMTHLNYSIKTRKNIYFTKRFNKN